MLFAHATGCNTQLVEGRAIVPSMESFDQDFQTFLPKIVESIWPTLVKHFLTMDGLQALGRLPLTCVSHVMPGCG